MNNQPNYVFGDKEAVNYIWSLYIKYVSVPADKASNNIVFVCKSYVYECYVNKLGKHQNSGLPTYKNISFNKEIIIANNNDLNAYYI